MKTMEESKPDQENQDADISNVRHCAFQYYNGYRIVSDETELTLEEAQELWNNHYDDMITQAEEGADIEVAIWINMVDGNYEQTLIHLCNPEVRQGKLYEPKYYSKL